MWIIKKALDSGSECIQSTITIKIMAEAILPKEKDLDISRNLDCCRPVNPQIPSPHKRNTHRYKSLYNFLLPKACLACDQG